HELRSAAAQHSLLAEQIGLGLLREGGVEYTAARTADTVSVGECLGVALAGGSREDSDQTRNAAPLLILAANEVARSFGRNQHDIEVLAGLDLLEVDIEAVRKQQRCAFLQALLHRVIQRLLGQVRHQHCDQVGAGGGIDGLGNS